MPPLRRCPRGALDAVAAGMLAWEPRLTRAQIAAKLGCHPKTLMNRERCPLLARVWAMLKAKRLERIPSGPRTDRRHRGEPIPNPEGGDWVGYGELHNAPDDDDWD